MPKSGSISASVQLSENGGNPATLETRWLQGLADTGVGKHFLGGEVKGLPTSFVPLLSSLGTDSMVRVCWCLVALREEECGGERNMEGRGLQ